MKNDSTISEEHLTAISELIEQAQAPSTQTLPVSPAAVSFTYSAGPTGANVQGWITYHNGVKVSFSGKGQIVYGAPIAQAVALPVVPVLNPEILLNANNVTWKAIGVNRNGVLAIYADGTIISIVPFVSLGWGVGGWLAEGTGGFSKA